MNTGQILDQIVYLDTPITHSRVDTFMDVQLPVRGLRTIEDSFREFTKAEVMSGDNQVFCEELNKKTDASKGLKFVAFPYFLILQLKRFDMDYNTWQRVKLHDDVSFPHTLDVAEFIDAAEVMSSEENPGGDVNREGTSNEYELFSVCIHTGSALGGHYYAYIKDFLSGKWLQFNDAKVTELTADELYRVVGRSNDGAIRADSGGETEVSTNENGSATEEKQPSTPADSAADSAGSGSAGGAGGQVRKHDEACKVVI